MIEPTAIQLEMSVNALIGFKNVGEAIYLRNHVLARLDAASSTDDPAVRQRALTFTFVGGGYAGVEAFAELEEKTGLNPERDLDQVYIAGTQAGVPVFKSSAMAELK